MKTLITLTALMVISTSAMAASYRTEDTKQHAIYVSDAVATEAQAQALAEDYIAKLETKNGMQLSQGLPTPHSRVNTRSLDVTDTDWSIVNSNGQYQAKIDIGYTYEYRTLRNTN